MNEPVIGSKVFGRIIAEVLIEALKTPRFQYDVYVPAGIDEKGLLYYDYQASRGKSTLADITKRDPATLTDLYEGVSPWDFESPFLTIGFLDGSEYSIEENLWEIIGKYAEF